MSETNCQICSSEAGKYVCPRCNILCCSVNCYKSEKHIQCSETFYQQCVQEELAAQQKDPESIKKMMEVLKRQREEQENSEDSIDLDSDDEEVGDDDDLHDRFQNINLDDADVLWEKLTDDEKKEFQKMIKTGDITKILPEWEPWWIIYKNRALVRELDAEEEDWKKHCPPVPDAIVPLSQLTKAVPSPNAPFILFNILVSYVFTSRWFKGNHDDMPVEAASTILALSAPLRANEIFDNVIASYSKFEIDLKECSWLSESESIKESCCEDVFVLIEGPSGEPDINYFVKASLSDLNAIFISAVEELKVNKHGITERFTGPAPKKSVLKLASKKIEYYLSWTVSYGDSLKEKLSDLKLSNKV